jgi:hypothetical protein
MPDGLSEMQEESVAAAVECLLKRGDVSRTLSMVQSHASTGSRGDDVSTLGDPEELRSQASSRISAVGQSALKSLLSQALGTPSASAPVVNTGDMFLDATTDDMEPAKGKEGAEDDSDQPDDDEMSDLSGDALSIAASAVGRKALRELISKSTQPGTSSGPRTRPRRSRKMQRGTPPEKGGADPMENVHESDSDDLGSHLHGDAATVASAVGRTALQQLLATSQNAEASVEEDRQAMQDSEAESVTFF